MTADRKANPERRYDWNRILLDLSMHGMNHRELFEATGIPASTLAGFKNLDVEPKHADGEKLLALWRARMHPPAPMIDGSVRIQRRVQR